MSDFTVLLHKILFRLGSAMAPAQIPLQKLTALPRPLQLDFVDILLRGVGRGEDRRQKNGREGMSGEEKKK